MCLCLGKQPNEQCVDLGVAEADAGRPADDLLVPPAGGGRSSCTGFPLLPDAGRIRGELLRPGESSRGQYHRNAPA